MVKNLFKGCLTVPNLLSLIRIFLIPAFAVLYYKGHIGWAVLMLALSGISDFLDGKIARRFNQVSELGKILDPVADKLTQITIAVMLYIAFRSCNDQLMVAFSWVFLVFLAKEAVMVIGGAIMIACGIKPGAAEIYGKVATFVFYLVMLVIIGFGPEIGAFRNYWTLPDPRSHGTCHNFGNTYYSCFRKLYARDLQTGEREAPEQNGSKGQKINNRNPQMNRVSGV